MNGFHGPEIEEPHASVLHLPDSSDMSRREIQRRIARAHRLRAEQLGAWGRKVAQTWASLFRGPRRLLPSHTRQRARWATAAKL